MANLFRIAYYLSTALARAYWKPAKLRKFQEKRLRCVVRYAYDNVPFYHRKLREGGVYPADVKCMEDLKKLPIVDKDELRHIPPRARVSMEFDINRLKVVRTGGSTGKPLSIYLTGVEADWRKAIYMRANILCGQKPRDRWVAITAPHHFSDVTVVQRRFGLFEQTCLSVFDEFDKHIDFLCSFKPDVLDGYSGALVLLGREVKKRGIDIIRPKVIFGNADLIDTTSRKFLEEVFAAPYCDQFGCAEVNRTAWNCLRREKYHMDVDSVLFEFVDNDGEKVAIGESGQILYTSLFNFAMPFIRYSVGDLGKPSNEFCSCGVKLPLMQVIEGRKDSVVVLPDGRFLSPRVFTVAMSMFKFYSLIEQFRIVQKKPEFFEIYLKMGESDVNFEIVKRELIANLFRVLNLKETDVSFDVKFVDDIPFSQSGKLVTVVSEVTHAI